MFSRPWRLPPARFPSDWLRNGRPDNRFAQGDGGDDTLTATGTVITLRGDAGAGDSCTLDGVRKFQGSGSFSDPYRGCEREPTAAPTAEPTEQAHGRALDGRAYQ